ncbi:PREDICTED: probable Xaa-Pro aminopeptidase 3 [Ceratosolen solmsi marchali]|uniref:Probable Xaa-Pro aminopeptidase 3 n=1 Tax=Ceratosolen solmsi marchali TaxID=326594 RepID=A0AAJ6YM59_9HYME|nr:PREDICTED: probable Xaa-Pro aminopeptidase 3 [Ceratosolen solmsi marchali]
MYTLKCISRLPLNILTFQPIAKCSSKGIQNATLQYRQSVQNVMQGVAYGQPTPWTHSHLIKDGEVVPGIDVNEFQARRNKLMEKISRVNKSCFKISAHVVIIPSASKVYMSDKIPYVFRQNTDFLYLTGCQEPNSILLMTAINDNYTSTLFMQPKNPQIELWEGPRTGVTAALPFFQVDQVFPVSEFHSILQSFLNAHKNSIVWYDGANILQAEVHQNLQQLIKTLNKQEFNNPKSFLHELRVIKSKAEQNLMRRSCEIASAAISETIRKSKIGMTEHELFATVDYESRMRGAEFLAYPPVVAGGKNANVIHYIANNQFVCDKEMVLMDAGCEYHGYTSDITRTWPINGTFTPNQRILYEIILDIQKTLINKLKEMPSLDIIYHDMCRLLGKRLQEECIISKNLNTAQLLEAAHHCCPHHVSHYLGMDVHDTMNISLYNPVLPGMIITVEPGIYLNSNNKFVPSEFHGLGIRLEDNILIHEHTPEILTESCPKEVMEIEILAQQNQT